MSADAGENFRQFVELMEDFKALGLTLGNYLFLRGPGGRPVGFSAGLRGDFDIVPLGSCWWCANQATMAHASLAARLH